MNYYKTATDTSGAIDLGVESCDVSDQTITLTLKNVPTDLNDAGKIVVKTRPHTVKNKANDGVEYIVTSDEGEPFTKDITIVLKDGSVSL